MVLSVQLITFITWKRCPLQEFTSAQYPRYFSPPKSLLSFHVHQFHSLLLHLLTLRRVHLKFHSCCPFWKKYAFAYPWYSIKNLIGIRKYYKKYLNKYSNKLLKYSLQISVSLIHQNVRLCLSLDRAYMVDWLYPWPTRSKWVIHESQHV